MRSHRLNTDLRPSASVRIREDPWFLLRHFIICSIFISLPRSKIRIKQIVVHCGKAKRSISSSGPQPSGPVFDFRAHFCHSAPMETHAFRLPTPGQRPGGPKAIFYQSPALMSPGSEHDVVNHHFRRHRQNDLLSLFAPDRWEVLRTSYFGSLLLPVIWLSGKWNQWRRKKRLRQQGI